MTAKPLDRFDLEQQILGCWGIVDDINLIIEEYQDGMDPELVRVLQALRYLYELKFDRTFRCFEYVMFKSPKNAEVSKETNNC